MEHESFYATAAQILPAIAVAAALELRYLVRRLVSNGSFDRPRGVWFWYAHVYTRVLAAASFGAVLLMISCLWSLKTETHSALMDFFLYWVFGLAPVLMALPLLGAVVDPRGLLRWYGKE